MPIKQCNLYLSEIHFTVITMDFGEVVRIKSKFLNDSVVLYNCVRRPGYVLKFSRKKDNIYRCCTCRELGKQRCITVLPCVHGTPVLLLPLLYECSVTTVLLSGANERRHYQRIGPSLTPSPRTIDGPNRYPSNEP